MEMRSTSSAGFEAFQERIHRNEIVIPRDQALPLLKAKGLDPANWQIPAREWKRIEKESVRLSVVCPPAAHLRLRATEYQGKSEVNLVLVDLGYLERAKLEQREALAMILHEVGNALNPFEKNQIDPADQSILGEDGRTQSEMFADDYARHYGLGREIVSSLKKCALVDDVNFKPEQVQRRIKRVEDAVPVSPRLRTVPR